MPKLTHLSLHHMALQDLSESALSLSPHISHLDLSYNQLPYIQALKMSSQLTSLNLTGNHEYSLSSLTLSFLRNSRDYMIYSFKISQNQAVK